MTTTPKLDMEQAAPLDIAAARLICEKAYASCGVSPPPWRVVNAQRFMHYRIIDVEGSEVISGDAAHPHGLLTFIAYARSAFPAALDRVEELERENADTRQSLDMALGPHCSGCGNSIDPECCWCGDGPESYHFDETHHFIPMGCDCARGERDWKKIASNLRELAWTQEKRLATSATLASTQAARIVELEGDLADAITARDACYRDAAEAMAERDAYRSMLCDLVPDGMRGTTTKAQWDEARYLLKHGPTARIAESKKESAT